MKRSLPRSIAFYFVLILNGIAILGLLASYLAGSISPATFWPLAFAGLAYPIMLMLAVGFTLLWAFKRKWSLLVLHIILIAVRADLVDAHFQLGGREEAGEDEGIRVMSFNVHLFGGYGIKDRSKSLPSTVNHIVSSEGDIVCLQEYFSVNKKDREALQQLSYGMEFHIEGYSGTPGGAYRKGSALATFSQHPIAHRGRLMVEGNESMRCIYTDLVIGNDTVRIYNVHLESIRIQEKDFDLMNRTISLAENDSLEQLKPILMKIRDAFVSRAALAETMSAHIAQCRYPVIVCGDFNDTPASYSYQRIEQGMKDSFREAGSGFGITYTRIPMFRIDNILFSQHFRASTHTVHHWPHSDHYAVMATLHLTPN